MKDYEDEAFDELEKNLQRKAVIENKKDAALRLAREVLKNAHSCTAQEYDKAIKAIDEALENK